MYPSGQGDLDSSYLERDPSANSPSEEEDEDLDEEGSRSDVDEVPGNKESDKSSLRIVISINSLRNFILTLIWMVNNFSSTIQRSHFNTLRDR